MSAVGTDAAFLLERALEEMDDIFRESEQQQMTFMQSSPEPPALPSKTNVETSNQMNSITKLLDELEYAISSHVLDKQQDLHIDEKRSLVSHLQSLNFVSQLFQDLTNRSQTTHISSAMTSSSYLKGPEEKIHNLEQERNQLLTQVSKIREQQIQTENELDKTRKSLIEFSRKNEELLLRSIVEKNKPQPVEKGTSQDVDVKNQVNHNQLLLDEGDEEMDKLKTRIDSLIDKEERKKHDGEDSTSGLKARLREKASECNRLKIQLEDMKQQQESKDNTIVKIQEQIQRLFEENEILRQQLASATSLHPNGTLGVVSPLSQLQNGTIPSTPESVRSAATTKSHFKTKDLFQMKSALKSASEPNLMRGEQSQSSIGLMSSNSINGDDAIYRPLFRRMISDSPFATWSVDQVQDWLRDEGLEEYAHNCVKCIKKGEDLIKFTNSEYERELGIHDPIQKKKLNLALKEKGTSQDVDVKNQAVTSNGPDYAGRLDHHWVARWLEDLGLPQYRLNFIQHKVDGRVLLNMTLDDILQLKVYNLLHHTSLKRAIQFLRHQKFHPQYLREVANQEENTSQDVDVKNQSEERCDHVMLWTSQRIVHWLRSVDLAEYAPNLRGSGVHGALMVLEPRFNADTLANLLSIPTNKSLLRRHVYTQYSTLLGEACQKQKELTQKTSDFVPLNGSEKHKLRKKGIKTFGTLRRRKSETDLESLLCPMELDVSNTYSPPPALDPEVIFDLSESTSLSPSFTNDNGSESTNDTSAGPRIAELSQEIEQMTSLLGSPSAS